MLGKHFRWAQDIMTKPVVAITKKVCPYPNAITIIGLLLSLAAAYYLSIRDTHLAVVFILLFSFFDMLDGALARELKKVTKFGGFLDAVLDRYTEGFLFFGIVVGYPSLTVPSFLAFFGSVMVSYTRARAEYQGVKKCDVGIAERSERLLLLVLGVLFNVLEPMLWAIAILAHLTAFQRVMYTRKELRG